MLGDLLPVVGLVHEALVLDLVPLPGSFVMNTFAASLTQELLTTGAVAEADFFFTFLTQVHSPVRVFKVFVNFLVASLTQHFLG